MRARARRLVPALPGRAWKLIGGMGTGSIGTGYAYSFLVIYLHYERGISLGLAGVCLSVVALGGLAVAPLVGICADRVGPRATLIAALLVSACGAVLLALAAQPWQAVCAALVFGIGTVSIDAPEMALLATVVRKEQRSAAFAVSYAAFSAGLSFGALAGGWVVDLSRPWTFQLAFVVAALPYLVYAAVVWRVASPAAATVGDAERDAGDGTATADAAGGGEAPARRGYGAVLRDKAFALLLVFNFAIFAVSFSQLNAAYPAFVVGAGHSTTKVVGLGLGANAVVIVVAQLVMLRLLTGRRRTEALAIACGAGAVCWLVVLGAAHVGGPAGALGFIAGVAILGLGETALSPSLYPLANDLACDRLRGRYNALMFMSEGGGRVVGPLLAGYALAAGMGTTLMLVLAGAMVAAGCLSLAMDRVVPRAANLIADSGEDAAEQPVTSSAVAAL